MARKLIDISIPLDNNTISDPEPFRPKITYMDHKKTAEQVCSFFPGLKPEDLPDGEGWAIEKIELITHIRPYGTERRNLVTGQPQGVAHTAMTIFFCGGAGWKKQPSS